MKTRFNTYDIICSVTEIQKVIGMRVNQVYDIDNKTYLIRLQRSEEKCVLLLESANRFHLTQYEWPKNVAPSGFTMKLRKHLKNKRLEHFTQLGIDRVVDLQFGTGEAAYHVILELYDRGNLVLTDYEWTILNVLRPHVEGDKVRFAVREKYPLDRAKQWVAPLTQEVLKDILEKSKPNDSLKKVLNPKVEYGGALLEHALLECGLSANRKVSQTLNDVELLRRAILLADEILKEAKVKPAKGYIIQKREERVNPDGVEPSFLLTNQEFHPLLFAQHRDMPYQEFDSFDRCVDEFFSTVEGQKIDVKTIQMEREAMKKLQNVRNDHVKRLTELERVQDEDKYKAELIIRNQDLCNQALLFIQTCLAKQMSWEEIEDLVKAARGGIGPPGARAICGLALNADRISLNLSDPHEELPDGKVDLSLGYSALANATRYFDQKRSAAKKQQKTIESQEKALKNAEKKTKQTLREAQTISNISKARKTYWFEKFYWFISSDNHLVLAGRDQQQNELLVKRHLRPTDVYVHADLSGASSVVVKCPGPPPPKALTEAGQLAVAYSVAWEAKVVAGAWWVFGSQVSKSAPTGEYLPTGSFMIRGKKNYLPSLPLTLGFSFMFRLEDSSIERHQGERSTAPLDQDDQSVISSEAGAQQEEEIPLSGSEGENSDVEENKEKTELELDTRKDGDEKTVNDSEDDTKEANGENEERNENDAEESDSDDDGILDTHVKVDHGTGKVVIENKRTESENIEDESIPSFPALPKKKPDGSKKIQQQQKKEPTLNENQKKEKPGLKRGQKNKLKKIKEKYKDQDEDDRAVALAMLKSSGQPKPPKRGPKKNVTLPKSKGPKPTAPPPTIIHAESDDEVDAIEDEPEARSDELSMLCQLTGRPLPEDELLFAVPVVAPYSTLHDYKFKVKLTPGTGKRGKAAKTALEIFTKDKNCSQREKDLLRAVRDQDLARNFPGKVKLSAPHLHK